MRIVVNGSETTCSEGATLLEVLHVLHLDPTVVVAELNGALVPAETFQEVRLAEGDCLELLHFVGGG